MNERRLFDKTIIDACFSCPELIDIGGREHHDEFRCRFLFLDASTRDRSAPRDLLWILEDCPLPRISEVSKEIMNKELKCECGETKDFYVGEDK